MTNFWALDLSRRGESEEFDWRELKPWPGPSRAFNLTVAQHNGYDDCVYVISGRRQGQDQVAVSARRVGVHARRRETWRRRADVPRCVMAGTGIGVGQSHILVLAGADGSLFVKADELKDGHPGFPRKRWPTTRSPTPGRRPARCRRTRSRRFR